MSNNTKLPDLTTQREHLSLPGRVKMPLMPAGLYKSIAQSKRWNRDPIITGSSDYDDRDGGGASLAVGSDFDDGERAKASPLPAESQAPTRPASILRGDAEPFRSKTEVDLSAVHHKTQVSPESTQSQPVESTASQPVATRPAVQPTDGNREETVSCISVFSIPLWHYLQAMAACSSSAKRAYMGCLTWMTKIHYAAVMLMDMYRVNQQHARSAIKSQDSFANDSSREQRGYCSHTASSSPTKQSTRDRGDAMIAEFERIRLRGAERQRAQSNQQQVNGNRPSEYKHLPTSATDSAAYRQNVQVRPPIALTANHDLQASPAKDIRLSPVKAGPVTQAHAGNNHQANGVRYDVQAPTFTPALSSFADVNGGVYGNMQLGQINFDTSYQKSQKQEITNISAPAVGSTRVSPPLGLRHVYQRHQLNELASDNNSMATVNAVQIPTARSGTGSQQQHDHSFANGHLSNGHAQQLGTLGVDLRRQYPHFQHSPFGANAHFPNEKAEQVRSRAFPPIHGAINTEDQLQGHTNGNTGLPNNQQQSSTPAADSQPLQQQGGTSSIEYSSEHQKSHMPGGQSIQAMSSLPLTFSSFQYQDLENGRRMMPANGGPHQEHKTQDGSPGPVNGYAYGLTSSVSDGSMMKYYTQQPEPPKDLIRVDNELNMKKTTVGPLTFGTPTKEIMANRSQMLQVLTENGKPSLTDLLDTKFLPFTESYRFASPSEDNGVIVIQNVSPTLCRMSFAGSSASSFCSLYSLLVN